MPVALLAAVGGAVVGNRMGIGKDLENLIKKEEAKKKDITPNQIILDSLENKVIIKRINKCFQKMQQIHFA